MFRIAGVSVVVALAACVHCAWAVDSDDGSLPRVDKEAVQRLFHGRLQAFNPAELTVELLYDFNNPNQIRDFVIGRGPLGREETEGLSASITDGKLRLSRTSRKSLLLDGVFTSVTASVDFHCIRGRYATLLVCADSEGNFYNVWGLLGDRSYLEAYDAGQYRHLTLRHPSPFAEEERGSMSLTVEGGALRARIGSLVLEAQDTAHASGHVGLGVQSGAVDFDNLRVAGVLDRDWLASSLTELEIEREAWKGRKRRTEDAHLLACFQELIRALDYAAARDLAEAESVEGKRPSFRSGLRAVAKAAGLLQTRQRIIKQAARGFVGEETRLETSRGGRTGTVEGVTDEAIHLAVEIRRGGRAVGRTRLKIPWAHLTMRQEEAFARQWNAPGVGGALARGLAALRFADTDVARHELAKDCPTPVKELVEMLIDVTVVGPDESAARWEWDALEEALGHGEPSRLSARFLLARIDDFEQAHGKTEFASANKQRLSCCRSRLERIAAPLAGTAEQIVGERDTVLPEALAHKTVYHESDGTCVMEAENYTIATRGIRMSTWGPATKLAGYAGSGYMHGPKSERGAAKRSLWDHGAGLLYVFEVRSPGRYYVALRTYTCCGRHNEVWMGVDSRRWPRSPDTQEELALEGIANAWHWIRVRYTLGYLKAGLHVIEIRKCEDSFKLDRLMIADDPEKLPARRSFERGPPESESRGRRRR